MWTLIERAMRSGITLGLCWLISSFNYWWLMIGGAVLYTEFRYDTQAFMAERHIYPGVGLLMLVGIGGLPLALALGAGTCWGVSRINRSGRYAWSLAILVTHVLVAVYGVHVIISAP